MACHHARHYSLVPPATAQESVCACPQSLSTKPIHEYLPGGALASQSAAKQSYGLKGGWSGWCSSMLTALSG